MTSWRNAGTVAAWLLAASSTAAEFGPGFEQRKLTVDDCTIAATIGGSGPAVVLLHGYAETSQTWRPLAIALRSRFTVVAFDLPGFGDSSIPIAGLDMTRAAQRLQQAVRALKLGPMRLVGHDIGVMVAYAYASLYPTEVVQLTLMEAFLPGVGDWRAVYDDPNRWHYRFHGRTAELLVEGRERLYLENHFWNGFSADPKHSLSETARQANTHAYARPGRMAAGFAYFTSLPKTAADFAGFSQKPLPMRVVTIGGDHANGRTLAAQGRLISPTTRSVILEGCGHWLLEENEAETISAVKAAIGEPR